jgi:opacity protein-like surface antigen
MKRRSLYFAILLLLIDGIPQSGNAATPRYKYEFGADGGSFLPSRIKGVTEIVPAWGLRASRGLSSGAVELNSFTGRSEGVSYSSAGLNYRLDLVNPVLSSFLTVGLHVDQYQPLTGKSQTGGGWNWGAGVQAPIVDPIWFRADFDYRFGPGTSLYVSAGLVYRLSSASSNGGS